MSASLTETSGPNQAASLRTLRIAKHFPFFLAVAEELNLHRAAERLNIAQSALSRRISDLERELSNTALFERHARGVALTEAGRLLADDVRRILHDIEEAGRRVRRVGSGDLGTLAVSFCEAIVRRPMLPAVLRGFRDLHPGVDLRATPLTSEAQRSRVRDGRIDIGFVIEEIGDHEDFASMHVGVDKFYLAVPTAHPLAEKPVVSLRDLIDEPLILPAQQVSPRLFGRMMSQFDVRGISPRIAAEVSAVDIAYGLVTAGLGLAIVTAAQPDRTPGDIVLKDLQDFDIRSSLYMIWRHGDESALTRNFVEVVKTELAAMAA